MYYDFNRILSYNALLYMLFGERGVGKTFGATKFVVNRFLKKHKQFAYIRRFSTEFDDGTLDNFFSDMIDLKEFKDVKFSRKGHKFYINDKLAGYALTLTKAQNLKGNKFKLVDTFIFDEFIIEDNVHHYLKGEVNSFLGLCETISRTRDFRCFMLANSVTTTNPYFLTFDLHLPYNNDIATFRNGTILVQYMKNQEYRDFKKKTRFGQMVEGTDYSKYAIDNAFIKDDNTFIEKKSKSAHFNFAFIFKNETFGVWMDYNIGKIYISSKYDPHTPYMFSATMDNHRPNTLLLKNAKKFTCWNTFIEGYKQGVVYFENQKIKSICYELIKMILT